MDKQDIENRLLENIIAVTGKMTVGKRTAEYIVGGERKLERLYRDGKVTCLGKPNVQNGKWHFNLAEVLQHCRPANRQTHKSNI